MIFTDDGGQVVARRWCWSQSEQSAARLDTTDMLITVEAHHSTGRRDIEAALKDLQELLTTYAGNNYVSGIVDASTPAFSD